MDDHRRMSRRRFLQTVAASGAIAAVDLTQENSQIGTLARHERDRLQQLTGGTATPQQKPPAQPPKN